MFPIKRTVFLCTATVLKNTVRLIGNIEYTSKFPALSCMYYVVCNKTVPFFGAQGIKDVSSNGGLRIDAHWSESTVF